MAGPDTQNFAIHCQGKKHRAGIYTPQKPQRQLAMAQFFSAAPAQASEANDPPPHDSDLENDIETSAIESQSSSLPLSLVMKCKGALPLGVPNANALRGKYPIMRHAHEKVHWRYVDGMGVQSVDPPCTGAARIGDSGEQLPCVPCAAVPSHPTMCVWMREERNADSSTPHFKLGFLNLTKRANGYRADKRNAVQVLQRVSDVCQTLVQKCDAHKALILAIGADNRPLASRRAARLIASGQSAAAVCEDMSKAIQVRSYTDTDRDLSCLVAIGIGGSRALCALNRAGYLPSADVSRDRLRLDPPLVPNCPPTVQFIVSRLPIADRPLLWDILVDEVFLEAMVGVDGGCNASGICTTCCPRKFSLRSEADIDAFAIKLESDDNVHLGEYGTVISIAAHDYDYYRVIPLWEVCVVFAMVEHVKGTGNARNRC